MLDYPVLEIARGLGAVGARFLDPSDALRAEAVARLPVESGCSPDMARAIVDGMAADWTEAAFVRALHEEFTDPQALDSFVDQGGRATRILAESPAVHVSSGNVPGVGATTMLRGLLVKSALVLKPGRGDSVLSVLVYQALRHAAPHLARAAVIVDWERDDPDALALLSAARLVVAYGGDDGIGWAQRHMGARARLVSFPHRVSAALVLRDELQPGRAAPVARALARATALFDQRGCVSPHTVWVQGGGQVTAAAFAEAVAAELGRLEQELPKGRSGPGEGSGFAQATGVAELEAATGAPVVVHGLGASWRVVLDERPGFRVSPGGRYLWVRPFEDWDALALDIREVGADVQTLGVAGQLADPVREQLVRFGVRRLASLPGSAWPPAWSRHDGVGPLTSLVRWVDHEPAAGD